MPEPNEKNVEGTGGEEEIKPDASGKFPETVPWNQYVKAKETIGNKLEAEKSKVQSLEEKLKNAPNAEEFTRIKLELDTTKTKLEETTNELTKIKEASTSEKKDFLKTKGYTDEELGKMTDEALTVTIKALERVKPKLDPGGGGGSPELKGKPQDLAVRAYS